MKLIYPDISYKIVGLLYEVYNELGEGFREKHYQKALEQKLIKNKIKFCRELSIPVKSEGMVVAKQFLDFLIDDKIILELKTGDRFRRQNIEQVYAYLRSSHLKLGIIANFTKRDVKIKRILNLY